MRLCIVIVRMCFRILFWILLVMVVEMEMEMERECEGCSRCTIWLGFWVGKYRISISGLCMKRVSREICWLIV